MNSYHQLLTQLSPVKDRLDPLIWPKLESGVKLLDVNLAKAREEGRNLRIAVVGQMKAGKSSFLNAAFFGFDLLPKADTPMTAALTRITYAERPRAEVIFYDADDWAGIEAKSNEYRLEYEKVLTETKQESLNPSSFGGNSISTTEPTRESIDAKISEDLRAANEVVEKAHTHGLNIKDYLGKRQVISNLESARDIASALQDFVGAGGHFTPITKMTELYVNDPRFKDLEVYDTPGFNDPVVSRGALTKSFLGQCDVVFLLSTLSQFFARADLELMRSQLSAAGVSSQAVILVGTQRDIALRQDRDIAVKARHMAAKYPVEKQAAATVSAMILVLAERMKKHVNSTLDQHLQNSQIDGSSRAILSAVQQSDPVFISSWCWLVAENVKKLSKDDQEQLAALCRDTGFDFDASSLRELSNIPALRQLVIDQRKRKDELLGQKEQNLINDAQADILGMVKELEESLIQRIRKVETQDIEGLRKQKKDIETRIKGGCSKLETVFDCCVVKAQQDFAMLKTEIRTVALNYSNIETRSETRTKSYEVSTSRWYNPLSWGGSETRYREVVTIYASAQDSIEKLNRFALETRRSLQSTIKDIVNLVELRNRVATVAMSLFDTGSADFDPEYMLDQVQRSLGRITIPEVDFGNRDYSAMIVKQFGSGRVSAKKIDGLREAQNAALASIIKDLETSVETKVSEISDSLNKTCKIFVDELIRDLTGELDTLCQDIEHRDKSLQALRQAQSVVEIAQQSFV